MFRAPVVASCIATLLVAASTVPPGPDAEPLIEFTAVDDDSARTGPPNIVDCGYYLQIHGATGHSGGSRLGAAVRLRADSLFVTVTSYRAWEFDPRDWQMARWTLRIGGLDSERYRVQVLAGSDRVAREIRLSFGAGRCAA